ncbi:uncharacterized protein LOC111231465 isoform X2 [Seriola dumerili]|uniref:uncharacterized protein LOC111231465 isoform X2 n=1 Tax=Seriola dumerili TaxID=41447 RepID=UPI000BBE7F59|nr:uncharacterized protein LOC111231465 isoform X2 [Seriola dumerili]XP_022614287.1 uncharacterized protein LOC111231465 isoform X2 [Seriola dumerili]
MDGLRVFLVVLFGAVSFSQDQIPKPVSEVTVRPGGNITLYCDCKISTGVYIVWYRNCSHENQPTLVLKTMGYSVPFEFLKNHSSESYDLLIRNITDSDEGLYYCGTQQTKVEDKELITSKYIYNYGNVATRIICDNTSEPQHHKTHQDCNLCWVLLFTLCPAFAVLSSLLSSLVVHQLFQKKARESQVDQIRPDTRGQTRLNQDEDMCYAALEIRQASQRPKTKKMQSSDFSTYSAINTSRV